MDNETHWKWASDRAGKEVVCCSISVHGMCAYHTAAAYPSPGGDFVTVDGSPNINIGLQPESPRDPQFHIRPGYEKQVQQQLAGRHGPRPMFDTPSDVPDPKLPD